MVSFFYAAAHCTEVKDSGTLSLDTKDLLEEATRKLIGGKETFSIGTGAEFLIHGGEKTKNEAYTFEAVKKAGGAAGSVPSLMFWTPDQRKILFEHHPRSVIYGEFGTGKTVLLTEKIKRMIQSIIDDQNKQGEQMQNSFFLFSIVLAFFSGNLIIKLKVFNQYLFSRS